MLEPYQLVSIKLILIKPLHLVQLALFVQMLFIN